MKYLNDELQMRSDWLLPICNGPERIKEGGKKAHSTQKPEALLYRVILAASQPGQVVLDPFFGSGTTGAVAKKLHRRWIGIELEERYVRIARRRLEAVQVEPFEAQVFDISAPSRRKTRLGFGSLLETGLLRPGQALYFQGERSRAARIKPDGRLVWDGIEGSIHQLGKTLAGGSPCNGWEHWYYENEMGELIPIDALRQRLMAEAEALKDNLE
jgi:modification methylase